jgi:hypothetical protein
MERLEERPGVHSGDGLPIDARFLQPPWESDAAVHADVAPHGWFNPNAMFSQMHDKRRHEGHGNDVAFTMRRGPLEFEGGAGTPFDGMPTRAEEEAAGEDGEEDDDDEEDEGEDGEGEDEEGGVEVEEIVNAEGGLTRQTRRKRM